MDIAVQPIVHFKTGEVIAHEILCRPPGGIVDFFRVSTPDELWLRESLCLEAAVHAADRVRTPVHINLTAASLPYFLETRIAWRGAVEIVEWGFPLPGGFGALVQAVRTRGMDVWIDDLSPLVWPMFRSFFGVSGFKIAIDDLSYANEIIRSGKSVIVERIETADDADLAVRSGVRLGQGYALGVPQKLETEVKS